MSADIKNNGNTAGCDNSKSKKNTAFTFQANNLPTSHAINSDSVPRTQFQLKALKIYNHPIGALV